MVITLRRAGVCADCGAALAAGTAARWYRSGKVYGLACHEPAPPAARRTRSAPVTRGRCEDAPCCGCCDSMSPRSVTYASGDYDEGSS